MCVIAIADKFIASYGTRRCNFRGCGEREEKGGKASRWGRKRESWREAKRKREMRPCETREPGILILSRFFFLFPPPPPLVGLLEYFLPSFNIVHVYTGMLCLRVPEAFGFSCDADDRAYMPLEALTSTRVIELQLLK